MFPSRVNKSRGAHCGRQFKPFKNVYQKLPLSDSLAVSSALTEVNIFNLATLHGPTMTLVKRMLVFTTVRVRQQEIGIWVRKNEWHKEILIYLKILRCGSGAFGFGMIDTLESGEIDGKLGF